jgi:hypothetical protein
MVLGAKLWFNTERREPAMNLAEFLAGIRTATLIEEDSLLGKL